MNSRLHWHSFVQTIFLFSVSFFQLLLLKSFFHSSLGIELRLFCHNQKERFAAATEEARETIKKVVDENQTNDKPLDAHLESCQIVD